MLLYVLLWSKDCKDASNKCKRCKCDTIYCQLEVKQTAGSAILAKEKEDKAVKGLYELVTKALKAMRLDFAEKKIEIGV